MAMQITVAAVAAAVAVGPVASRKPNIIHILADDFGWAELGAHREGGSSAAQNDTHTPNLDKLVSEEALE
jgi:hypothetical protein